MPVAEIGMSSFMFEEEDPSLLVYATKKNEGWFVRHTAENATFTPFMSD